MKLLYVIDSLAPGGAEMSLAEMAPALVAAGIDLHVVPLGSRLDLKERLEEAGAQVHVGSGPRSRSAFVRRVAALIDVLRPDLVHTTLFEADISGRVAARLKSTPSSTSLVGDTYGRRPASNIARAKLRAARTLDQATARFACRFHAVSEHLASSAHSHLSISRGKIHVIPRGREQARFPFQPAGVREAIRDGLGLPIETPVVIAVGRLEPVKGLLYLIDALPILRQLVPDVHLLVAGKDGAAGPEIRAAAAASGAPVTFLGHRTDVAELLVAADVLAFPSLSEGSPGTIIEAMASGCPIVASAIPPNLEVLGGHEIGIATPVADSQRIAHALASVLTGSADVEAMVRKGRERFLESFEMAAVAARMSDFFFAAAAEGNR